MGGWTWDISEKHAELHHFVIEFSSHNHWGSVFCLYHLRRTSHHYQHLEGSRPAAVCLKPVSAADGAAAWAEAATWLQLLVKLAGVWKEAASATRALLVTRLPDKHPTQPEQVPASAAAEAFHPSTPPPSLLFPSWEAATLSTGSTRNLPEKVTPRMFHLCV